MIELRKMSQKDAPVVKGLYEGAFPPEERRPWDDLLARALGDDMFFSARVVVDDGRMVGFITIWRLPMARYIEHFAIEPAMRGRGIGGEVIDRVVGEAASAVLLEAELPEGDDSDVSRRRIEFYRRHGFDVVDGIDYVQPPYSRQLPEVPMLLMSTQAIDDVEWAVRILHQIVYNQ